jgi:hypothetical protein
VLRERSISLFTAAQPRVAAVGTGLCDARLTQQAIRIEKLAPDQTDRRLQNEERGDCQHQQAAHTEQQLRTLEPGHPSQRLLLVEGDHAVHLGQVGRLPLENAIHGVVYGSPIPHGR